MKNLLSKAKLFVFTLAVIGSMAPALFLNGHSSASTAQNNRGYFSDNTNVCYRTNSSDTTCNASPSLAGDVLAGRMDSPAHDALDFSSVPTGDKAAFIGQVLNKYDNGGPRNSTGAAMIINEIDGLDWGSHTRNIGSGAGSLRADFRERVNNPMVEMVDIFGDPNQFSGRTSFYDPRIGDDFFAAYNGGSRWMIVFRDIRTKEVYTVIERPCGNAVPGLPPIPKFELNGTTSVSVNNAPFTTQSVTVRPGDYLQFKFDVNKRFAGNVWGASITEEWYPVANSGRTGNIHTDDPINFPGNYSWTYGFGIVQQVADGTQYCPRVIYKPMSSASGAYGVSNIVCATVVVPDDYAANGGVKYAECYYGFDVSAFDRDNLTASIRVELRDASGTTVLDTRKTDSFNEVTFPINGYADGVPHDYKLYIYSVDIYGQEKPSNKGPTVKDAQLPPCYEFDFNPVAGATATPSDENPTSIKFEAKASSGGIPGPGCVHDAEMTYEFYKLSASGSKTSLGGNGVVITGASNCLKGSDGPADFIYGITGGVQAGEKYCATATVSPGGGIINRDGNVVNTAGPPRVSPGAARTSALSCVTITNKPFLKTFAAGVKAGGEFASVNSLCSGGGNIKSWFNNTDSSNGYGSSADLTVLALTQINGFASNYLNKSTAPTLGFVGRTFANTVAADKNTSADKPNMGGNFDSGSSSCFPSPTVTNPNNAGNPNLVLNAGPTDGAYDYTGNVRLKGGGPIVKKNVAVHVKGDLYIERDIAFSNWTDQASISSFTAIVEGNIYIDYRVTQLDGLFIAKRTAAGSTTSGHIYTCSLVNQSTDTPIIGGSLFGTKDQYSYCNNQLVVHGAFVADYVDFQRTYGSLRDEQGVVGGCSNAGTVPAVSRATCAAEVFDFSPELYLANPPVQYTSQGKYKYDAISSLPPVL